ncbi:glutamine--tRNA ligase/YqeY domain fusion protein [Marinoscillum furvescens]|uniref:Glutamine--tRNA ligase n=1 Tax=Marinoscillum furvescens DSM 4134 TaxID=1122208 RepID=A0A3D9L5Y0_MARFU|nr:glutamine--tRNA ligase/YqeY domain fusion protein [Marinoscillum furvescens]REE01588.1 glutaminyl-tRNA synthetase [Marinoscillum furvescens DSM 4134]
MENEKKESLNFIEQMIDNDLKSGKHQAIQTRFPPEPNGYLHIGHAKSICLNFGLAEKFGGKCNLRFDDTNPEKEDVEYVDSIKSNIEWLGFKWDGEHYASDYFAQLYEFAVALIKKGKAYVDDLSQEEFNAIKGTPTQPGKESPFRSRSVEENLQLFAEMKDGKYQNGEKVLRAKIDMSSPNMHMRDPILYRIKHVEHHRTANEWCIYPTYDFAHGQSDSIEKVTHSLCTLEFEVHRPLYEWLISELEIFPSKQTEFARLNLSYTIVSKRKLLELVEEGHVAGWDDPRMPTISGIRRRGFTPDAIKKFIKKVGVARRDGITDVALLEHAVREDLNKKTNRVFGILDPVKLVITNWPEDKEEVLTAVNNPEDEAAGTRDMLFGREVYIDRGDFLENPPSPRKWYRLGPEREVRLKYAYIIKCTGFDKDENGEITTIYAEYDPETRSGQDTSGKKVKGTLGWVSVKHAVNAEIRMYDRLFHTENLNDIEDDFKNHLNPNSLEVNTRAVLEGSLKDAKVGDQVQFERVGYFRVDEDTTADKLVFNRTITLRDNWEKQKGK